MDYQRIRHIQLSDGSNLGTILYEHIHFLLMSWLFKGCMCDLKVFLIFRVIEARWVKSAD
jgi:hypothetical protein